MKSSVLAVSCCFGLLWALAAGARIPKYFEPHKTTQRNLTSAQVQRELGNRVSNTTLIFGPDDARYDAVTTRWTDFSKPKVQVVIEPGIESDVATIVQYCNENSIEFLAVTGGHGLAESLRRFDGIQISTWQLDQIDIQPSGKSAWFGGGLRVGAVTHGLWDKGLVAPTGGCECVGMLGAGLGGGHGRLEGLHGLISDNILQFNMVLANGSAICVNATNHSDLLWGMKGAGHNFGIVTSYEINVWPRGPDTWHYHNYIWRGEQLETVFTALNNFHGNGTTPVNMTFEVGSFTMDTAITSEEPVLFWTFAYRGSAEEAEKLLAPFNAIEAAYEESGDVPYPQIAEAQGTAFSSPICQEDHTYSTSTAFLKVYNLTAERLIFDGFKRRVIENPALANGTNIVHEGYSTEGVEAIPSADTAYPFRHKRHLNLFYAAVTPGVDQEAGWAWAAEVRDHWNAGQPGQSVDAYVNYATGFETLEQRYGHEMWRLERLRGLKAKYDPHNRFRFYNPIVTE